MKKVLKLVIPPKEGNKEQEEYTYDKLQDLQSRLMLVAGEAESSKQSIDRFNSVCINLPFREFYLSGLLSILNS